MKMVKFPFTEIKELGNERGERRFPFWKQTILTDSWCCSQIWPWEMLTLLYGIWAAFFPSFIVTLFIFRWIRHNGWKVLLLWNKDLPLLELEQTFSEVELDTQTTANWENVIWIHMFVDISGVLWHGTATNTLTDSPEGALPPTPTVSYPAEKSCYTWYKRCWWSSYIYDLIHLCQAVLS